MGVVSKWDKMAISSEINTILNKIGETTDTDGSDMGGSVFGKLNSMITDTQDVSAQVDDVFTQAKYISTQINDVPQNVIDKMAGMSGAKIFLGDGTFTVPDGVTKLKVSACAAGGVYYAGQGVVRREIEVKPAQQILITVGANKDTVFGAFFTLTKASVSVSTRNNVFGVELGIDGGKGTSGVHGGSASRGDGREGGAGGSGGIGGMFGYGGGGGGGAGGGGGYANSSGGGTAGNGGNGGNPPAAVGSNFELYFKDQKVIFNAAGKGGNGGGGGSGGHEKPSQVLNGSDGSAGGTGGKGTLNENGGSGGSGGKGQAGGWDESHGLEYGGGGGGGAGGGGNAGGYGAGGGRGGLAGSAAGGSGGASGSAGGDGKGSPGIVIIEWG